MPGFRSLARNHDFTILWVGETVSTLGSRMSLFAFPLVGYAISGSAMVAALAEAAHLAGMSLALLPAGVAVDRHDRRRLMTLVSGSGALLYLSLAVAGVLGSLSVAHLVVVSLLTGVGAGIFRPAQTSAIRSVVPTDDLPTALAQNQAREHVAGLVGAPLGGLLYAVTRWLPFAVDAFTYAISCLTLSRLRTPLGPARRRQPGRSVRHDLLEGLRFVVARPFFRVLLTWAALANLVVNALFFAALLRMVEAGHHPAEIGLAETGAALGGLVGAAVAPALIARLATGRLTVLIAWAQALPVLPLIWWGGPLAVGGCLFAMMLLNPAGNAGIGAYRMAVTPADLQGRVSAASTFVAMSVMSLSPLAGGYLLAHWGGQAAIGTLAAAFLGLALMVTLSRSIRSVPRPTEWATVTEVELAA
ncbi:MFS transporter [Nocardioides sp.]|uniref:MFS transporter n=1 Tax=Nocardioides sp. TaxID=35761 RepID=UPI003526EB21